MNCRAPSPSTWALVFAVCALCGSIGVSKPVLAQTPELAKAGLSIMTDTRLGNCIACHALPQQAGTPSTLGPALAAVGSKYNASALTQWVFDARKLKPTTLMPPFGTTEGARLPSVAAPILTEQQIAAVVATLQTFR